MTRSEKEILLLDSDKNFNLLLEVIETVPSSKRGISIETQERDKNFRDVLMHLYEWHAMLERWHREGINGDIPFMPAPGYKWRNIGLLNVRIWENYQDVTLNQAIKKLKLSHERVMDLIKSHTNEQIMTKKQYKWTKTSNLYSYFAANTVDHYNWAIKKCEEIARFINCQSSPTLDSENKTESGFLLKLSSPARNALVHEGIDTLHKLSKYTEKEILKIHGIGPASLPTMRTLLEEEGLCFKK